MNPSNSALPRLVLLSAATLLLAALPSCGTRGGNPNGEVLAAAPSGSATLFAKKSEDRHFGTTELFLARGQVQVQGEQIALPEGLAQSHSPAPRLRGIWSPDEMHLLLLSQWRKSDQALLCDLSKPPLKFKELREPDWAPILLGEEQKQAFERWRYNIFIESAKFSGKDEVLLEYSVAEGESDIKRYKFKYRLGKGGMTGPVPLG